MAKVTIKFRSKFEKRVFAEAVEAGRKLEYEPKDAKLDYVIPGNYLPDFRLPSGVLVECKGHLKYEDRRKMIAVKKAHPELDIRFVFMKADNPIKRGAKMNYAQWAETNGFPWAEGAIPEGWFKRD